GIISSQRFSERILVARCDGFALGGLLAILLARRNLPRERLRLCRVFALSALAGTLFLLAGVTVYRTGWLGRPAPVWPPMTILACSVLFFGVIGLVVLFAGRPWLAPLRLRPIVYLGQISYGIYLYHYVVYWLIDGCSISYDRPWWVGLEKITATVVVSIL